MATSIDFPSGPSSGDTYSYGNVTYIWDGTRWHLEPTNNTLSALTDTILTGVTNEDTLVYSASTGLWYPSVSVSSLSGLTDTTFDITPTDGQSLTWNNTASSWTATTSTLSGLTDTTFDITPTDGQSLTWNDSTSSWSATTITGVDALSGLTDTTFDITPTDGQSLTWNDSASSWSATTGGVGPDTVGVTELKDELKASTTGFTEVVENGFGEQIYTATGTHTFTATTSYVSVVCIGGGGGGREESSNARGGGGGGLGYKNNISVVSGNTYTVFVGSGGARSSTTATSGTSSYFSATTLVAGHGGDAGDQGTTDTIEGGTYTGDGGGNGGNGAINPGTYAGGGGGAGGYSGAGGGGGATQYANGSDGAGGAGGGGGNCGSLDTGSGGGGTGLFGEGSSGAGGIGSSVNATTGGGGGSGGVTGGIWSGPAHGGGYGGGGSGTDGSLSEAGNGADGAVRIIWGIGATFPLSATTSGATEGIIEFDWDNGIQFEYTMTGNTFVTFANIVQGKTITLVIDGNYTLTMPDGVNVADLSAFDGTLTNYIQIYCVDSDSETFLASLKNYP